jgi:glycosyltransferase involved in cell wall biosynthesis
VQIVVNTRLLIKNKLDGIGWFTYQTLKRICQNNPQVHFIFLFDRNFDETFIFSNNVTPVILGPPARHPFLYCVWFQFSVKSFLNKMKPDLFVSPDGFLVLGAKCKQLAVIHDLNFLHYPQDNKWLTAKYYNYFFPKFARVAARIATVSEFSKQEISSHYQIEPNKIDVVYNGINEFIKPLNAAEKQQTKIKYSNDADFFLHLGSLSPRKNIPNLIKAFALFKKETGSEIKLILAGAHFWGLEKIKQVIRETNLESEIIFTGRLDNADLAALLGAAKALLFLSYYEGFGIPLIEAMEANVPIICSNITSLPEIAGTAAITVNPFNLDEIKNAMKKLDEDEMFVIELIKKGQIQKQNFSWNKTADLLWQSILETQIK